ncbi:MAG TPA: YqjK family protein [Methylophilaceae bacterium]|nr:YqjK family protein [Methylophilaceae bacterium]
MKKQRLMARRAQLIKRIEQQRNDVKELVHSFEKPINLIDRCYAGIQKVRQQPKLMMLGALVAAYALRKPLLRMNLTLLAIAKFLLPLK